MDRLHHIKPKEYTNPSCPLCSIPGHPRPETLAHALTECEANNDLLALLLNQLQVHVPGLSFRQVLTLDLELEPSIELPLTWLIGSGLLSLWKQREEGKINLTKIRAELEARCQLLRDGKIPSFVNSHVLIQSQIQSLFERQRL